MQKAIFLDRDGVINSTKGHYYVYKIKDFKINEGITESLKRFSDAGYLLFIITNQGGIAKNIYTAKDVQLVHNYLEHQLAKKNIKLTQIYFCPHHDSVAPCKCRKPNPYFIKQAIKKFNIDPKQSYLIGDSKRDIQAADRAGVKGILITPDENISKYCSEILKS